MWESLGYFYKFIYFDFEIFLEQIAGLNEGVIV